MQIHRQKLFEKHILPLLKEKNLQPVRHQDLQNGIYIYGAGDLGTLAIQYCEACEIPVLGFLDQKITKPIVTDTKIYQVTHPASSDSLINKRAPVAVAIASSPNKPILEYLSVVGFTHVIPFYALTAESTPKHPLNNGWTLGELDESEIDCLREVCHCWADLESWYSFSAFLAWHANYSEISHVASTIDPAERYVIPEVLADLKYADGDFLDVGAHRGEAVEKLIRKKVKFRRYHLIEPDPKNREVLKRNLMKSFSEGAEVRIYSEAIGLKRGTTEFVESLGYCSQVWHNSSSVKKPTITIDDLELSPHYIKVHTEGNEASLLMGGIRTIERYRPTLAFSVYHSRKDCMQQLLTAMKTFPFYRWRFRLHAFQGTGAFVYATRPQEIGIKHANRRQTQVTK
jgi:FkbM family methyltransferase